MARTKPEKRGPGRPALPDDERRELTIMLYLTAAEKGAIVKAAEAEQREPAVFARMRLLEAIQGS